MNNAGDFLQRPNFLFIMTDQHRFDYLSCAGSAFTDTNNIDSIAQEGMRFSNCYTNSPVCAPARIALATGIQPFRLGVLDNYCYLPLSTPTYYQRLRDYGYRVGCVGKLDLSKPDGYIGFNGDRPCTYSFGFTHPHECEGKNRATMSCEPIGPYTSYLDRKNMLKTFHNNSKVRKREDTWFKAQNFNSVLDTEDYHDVYIGRKSEEWLRNITTDHPFHLFVSFVGPHTPFEPPAEYWQRYKEVDVPEAIEDNLESKPEWVKKLSCKYNVSAEQVPETRRRYAASIKVIDDMIGLIIDTLRERNLLENTYIIFTSDHGEMLGDYGLYTKHVAYEPSIHIPLIISGPCIPKGQVCNSMIELIDLNPTICDLAGIPRIQGIDAKSFLQVLKREEIKHRSQIICSERNFRCIRTDRYKYIENYNDVSELYDLVEDPCELNNISEKKADIVLDMKKCLKKRCMEGKWNR